MNTRCRHIGESSYTTVVVPVHFAAGYGNNNGANGGFAEKSIEMQSEVIPETNFYTITE